MATPVNLLVFSVEGNRLALNLEIVELVVSSAALAPIPGAPSVVMGMLNLHGNPVPVISLRSKLQLTARHLMPNDEIIILRRNGCVMGIAVDDVEGVSTTADIFPFDQNTECTHVSAAARVGDGIVLIQDMDRFFSAEEERFLLIRSSPAKGA